MNQRTKARRRQSAALSLLLGLIGCGFGTQTLEEVDPDAIPANPTYSEHVAPILDFYCVACHDPNGQVGALGDDKRKDSFYGLEDDDGGEDGIDLTNFAAVVDEFDDIEGTILLREMPPGGARRLTAREEAILSRWADQGFAP